MTTETAKTLYYGLYRLYWKEGGNSLASVGGLYDGTRWFAPTNWTNPCTCKIISTRWDMVTSVELILKG